MDINEKGNKHIGFFKGLLTKDKDIITEIQGINKNLAEYDDNKNFYLLGDKLIETYFLNNLPLFADRLLQFKKEVEVGHTINTDKSCPFGLLTSDIKKIDDTNTKFNLTRFLSKNNLNEFKNDLYITHFIKKILMIPEKDLITMLTTFNNLQQQHQQHQQQHHQSYR